MREHEETIAVKVKRLDAAYLRSFEHLFHQKIANVYDVSECYPDYECTIEYESGEIFRVCIPNGAKNRSKCSDYIGRSCCGYSQCSVVVNVWTKELYVWMFYSNEGRQGPIWFPLGKKLEEDETKWNS